MCRVEFTESNLVNFSGQDCGSNGLGGISTWSGFSQTDSYQNQTNAVNALTIEKNDGGKSFTVSEANTGSFLNGDGGEEIYDFSNLYYSYRLQSNQG